MSSHVQIHNPESPWPLLRNISLPFSSDYWTLHIAPLKSTFTVWALFYLHDLCDDILLCSVVIDSIQPFTRPPALIKSISDYYTPHDAPAVSCSFHLNVFLVSSAVFPVTIIHVGLTICYGAPYRLLPPSLSLYVFLYLRNDVSS